MNHTTAVVTGAASGIGRAIVELLQAKGISVAALDVDRNGLASLSATGGSLTTHCCDVGVFQDVAATAECVGRAHANICLLVNNAGISVSGRIEDLSIQDFEAAMATNFWGVVHCSRAFLPYLRSSATSGRPSTICNVLSDFALMSLPTKAAYAASKHAARAFTEALAAEVHDQQIGVLAVYPGATNTPIVKRGFSTDPDKRELEARFLSRGMSADFVARRIVRAIERRRTRAIIGADSWAIDVATRVAPTLVSRAVRRWWRRVPFL